jgi:O-antigen/teichoic acid export membrane protein
LNEKSNFGSNVLLAVLISYIGSAASFISSILVARLIGVAGKGIMSLFIESVFGIVIFSGLGIGNGQIYHVSKTPDRIKFFFSNAYLFSLILSGGTALGYFTIGYLFNFKLITIMGWEAIFLAIIVAPVMQMIVFQRQYFLAIHNYKIAKANYALTMGLPLLIYFMVYFLGLVTVNNLITAFVIGQVISFIYFQMLIYRVGPKREAFSWRFARDSFSFGIRQYLSDVLQYLSYRIDFFLVAWFLGQNGLGLYSVAVAMAEITSRLTHEIGTILFPAFASGNISPIQAAPILRKIFFVSLVIAVVLVLASYHIIVLIFGEKFVGAVPAFRLLLVGTLGYSMVLVTFNYTAASGQPELGIPIFAITVILEVILNIMLLPKSGIVGAAIAATVSYWCAACIFLIIFCKKNKCSVMDAMVIRLEDLKNIFQSIIGIRQIIFK